jgi:transcriptional regulator with XRE-family HTH domain
MHFSSNIKLLRKRRGRTQDDIAFSLNMKRPTLSGYENGVSEPNLEALVGFSNYYKISIDTLVKVDLSSLRESELSQLERGYDVFITGSNLRVLATTVDRENNDNVELVSESAKAGYRTGFADPEYVSILPAFNLPLLNKYKKHRGFQISGDSMLPIADKSYVIGQYIEDWGSVKSFYPHVILTIEDGIVFKVVENKIQQDGKLTLHSLNPFYEPYDIDVKDVREIWKYVYYLTPEIPEANLPKDELVETVKNLQKQMRSIQTKLNL